MARAALAVCALAAFGVARGAVLVTTTTPDGKTETAPAKDCQVTAPCARTAVRARARPLLPRGAAHRISRRA